VTPAIEAALCLVALAALRRLKIAAAVSGNEVIRRLGIARSYAYETRDRLAELLERGFGEEPGCRACRDANRTIRRLTIANRVLVYLRDHPGAWCEGRRNGYSAGLRAFVLSLASEHGVGKDLTQADFAAACEIPLPTLKTWWAEHAPSGPAAPAVTDVPRANPSTDSQPTDDPPNASQAQDRLPPDDPALTGFTLEMLRIIREYESWHGTLEAFVGHLRDDLGIHYGRERVTHLLHLAAARKLLKKPPAPPSARGATVRPPPGVQWTSDGKEVELVVGEQTFVVTWQPMVDVGSAATVGEAVRPAEDAPGVVAAFREGIATTGAPPRVLLLDNKAPNRSVPLRAALPDETTLMHATLGRAQNKAVIEGQFGLFAQDLGRVIAVVDTHTAATIALSVAEAVTRAYATGRNHRPRRKDGKSRYDLYREGRRLATPEQIAAAVELLRRIKERIDTREAREAARRDPRTQALLEHACARFGFTDDGDLLDRLRGYPLETVESAVAIYAAKQSAGSLPVDAGLRYFGGIVRNVQHERELEAFANELVRILESRGQLLADYLQRQAMRFATLDLPAELAAILDQLLTVPAPAAQTFWRHRLTVVAATAPAADRPSLRAKLCARIRRCFVAVKQLRRSLADLVIRLLTPEIARPAPA
jgi:hypothetical protein